MTEAKEQTIKEVDPRLISEFEGFLRKIYYKQLVDASNKGEALAIDFKDLDEYNSELAEILLNKPNDFFQIAEKSLGLIELQSKIKIRVKNLASSVSIRDLRSVHLDKFISVEGTVRKASEIRPEILETLWECPECGTILTEERKGGFVFPPRWCDCGNKKGFKQAEKKMVDTRWIVIEEPFELTEGERPSQVTILLTGDLVNQTGRRITDPGNRLKITGVLKDIPKLKMYSAKLDFYLDSNYAEPTEIGWQGIEITKEDEEEIKRASKDESVYKKLVASLAPGLYGMEEIKESIILQMFSGVQQKLKDGTSIRGEIHILLVGDPASGKCVSENTKVVLKSGEIKTIKDMVEKKLSTNTNKIEDGVYAHGNDDIISLGLNGQVKNTKANIFWKRSSTKHLYKIKTYSGKEIDVTPTHPFFVCAGGLISSKKAEEMEIKDFIATPNKIVIDGKQQKINIEIKRSPANAAKHIIIPSVTTPEFCRFLAYLLAEGYVQKTKTTGLIWFTNNDEKLLQDFDRCTKIFGLDIHKRKPHKGKKAFDLYFSSIELLKFLENLEPKILEKSKNKKIPDLIMKCSDEEITSFLKAFFDCEANVTKNEIQLTSASKEMLEQIQIMLLRFGIVSSIHRSWKKATNSKNPVLRQYYRVSIAGENIDKFKKSINFSVKNKKTKLSLLKEKKSITNTVPDLSQLLKSIRLSLNIRQSDFGVPRTTFEHFERGDRNPTKNSLTKIVKSIKNKTGNKIADTRLLEKIRILETISKADIFWDRIKSIEKNNSNNEWVYDLQVPEVHNFIGNGIFVHNSQLMKLVPQIVPRGKYVSGKGTSTAGLTATVTKDEQFMGGWVLEAGAMVLAHRGLLSVDEFEKMAQEDQVAMHEALEQGTVSIAKASIVATLPAQTSVLAGGNPKFSRFDPYLPIAKQITIPDTLLSRFDLKFILKDVPNSEQDKKVIDHIVSSREEDYEASKPFFERNFVRKYIAYAKEHCKPVLTAEAAKMLKKFYLETRKHAEGGDAPIPITLRQFEALIRLSEASAKVQLCPEVRKEHAQRAIRLMKFSLKELGMDPSTGMIDVDRSEGLTTSSERSNIRVVLDIINDLSKKNKEIKIAEIEEAARKEGIENIDELIDKLKREGLLFEPSPGNVQKV